MVIIYVILVFGLAWWQPGLLLDWFEWGWGSSSSDASEDSDEYMELPESQLDDKTLSKYLSMYASMACGYVPMNVFFCRG